MFLIFKVTDSTSVSTTPCDEKIMPTLSSATRLNPLQPYGRSSELGVYKCNANYTFDSFEVTMYVR